MLSTVLMVLLQASPVPTFSAQVQVVGLTVTAVDAATNTPVAGLQQADFQVLEDGRRQHVIHFEQEDVPASVLVMLDSSASMKKILPAVRESARLLIASLREGDEVAVVSFDSHFSVLTDFTTDHEAASGVLDEVVHGGETALNMSLYTAARMLERRFPGNTERRRILVLLSDGENTEGVLTDEAVLEALRGSAVVCYVVHLQRLFYGMQASASEKALLFMRSLSYETGGRVIPVPFPYEHRDILLAYVGIADELGAQYHLVYESSTDTTRAGMRTITVALTGRIGIKLRYRRGYYIGSRY